MQYKTFTNQVLILQYMTIVQKNIHNSSGRFKGLNRVGKSTQNVLITYFAVNGIAVCNINFFSVVKIEKKIFFR